MTENKYFVTHSGGTVHCDSISRELKDGSFEELSYQDIVNKLNENEELKDFKDNVKEVLKHEYKGYEDKVWGTWIKSLVLRLRVDIND